MLRDGLDLVDPTAALQRAIDLLDGHDIGSQRDDRRQRRGKVGDPRGDVDAVQQVV
jgi:hypothetical protein